LSWLIEGKRNSEIAIILGIRTRTVDKHVENILFKLDVRTRTAAVNVAVRNGVIAPNDGEEAEIVGHVISFSIGLALAA